jgi:hypothetical protein
MHDCDRQDHTLREGLTEKLSRLRWDVWVGNGHGPRSSPPIRRNRAVSLEHLHDRDLALICLKSTHVAAIISSVTLDGDDARSAHRATKETGARREGGRSPPATTASSSLLPLTAAYQNPCERWIFRPVATTGDSNKTAPVIG